MAGGGSNRKEIKLYKDIEGNGGKVAIVILAWTERRPTESSFPFFSVVTNASWEQLLLNTVALIHVLVDLVYISLSFCPALIKSSIFISFAFPNSLILSSRNRLSFPLQDLGIEISHSAWMCLCMREYV